jgi:ATP-dependent exoDNAse (exonuclease V) beta subunit
MTSPAARHVTIRASAGSGKTFQLSNRYLKLALEGVPLETVLATTFTRKAAGEILDRILFRLAEAALDEGKRLALEGFLFSDPSSEATLADPRRPRLTREGILTLLAQTVRNLHRLRISTLDSFFMQLAGSFSLELGIPPGWRIADDMEAAALRAEAVRRLLGGLGTAEMVRLMHLLSRGEVSRSVQDQILDLGRSLSAIYRQAPPEAWSRLQVRRELSAAEIAQAIERLADAPLPAETKRYIKARGQDLERAENDDWLSFLDKGMSGKVADGSYRYYNKPIEGELAAAYEDLVEHARAVLIHLVAYQTEATGRLMQAYCETESALKQHRRVMQFEDITLKLCDSDLASRFGQMIHRLDAKTAHLLLDEFQDTAAPQWHVLRPFARRLIDSADGTFFCVGDVKQAIYGWRGGVPELFDCLPDELGPLSSETLNRSWRSSRPVIETVNRLFGSLETNEALESEEEAVLRWSARFDPHVTARRELPGYGSLETAPAADTDQEEKQLEVTLGWAIDRIVRMHREAPGLSLGVLVRKNRTVGMLIDGLRRRGVDASEEGGNPLDDSPAVQLLLSALTLADHPGDTVARYHLAQSPLGPELALVDHRDDKTARNVASGIRRQLAEQGYAAMLRRWMAPLAPECDSRDLGRLVQLLELAHAYESEATLRADDFVRRVQQTRVENPSASPVRVMTIHQSKGLQFDMVVLPELDFRLVGQPPTVVVGRPKATGPIDRVCRYVSSDLQKMLPESFRTMFQQHRNQQIEEALCLLYVAMTRAIHQLTMIIDPPKPKNDGSLPPPGKSFAGMLRAALPESPIDAELFSDAGPKLLFEIGDARWKGRIPAERKRKVEKKAAVAEPIQVRLSKNGGDQAATRDLQRRSPSAQSASGPVRLGDRISPTMAEASEAMLWGTAMHACFEQVEWADSQLPDAEELRAVIRTVAMDRLDEDQVLGAFFKNVNRPAVRRVLSRKTYAEPDPSSGSSGPTAVGRRGDLVSPIWKVERERPFSILHDGAVLRGSIDRLVVLFSGPKPVGADILDFKTDRVGDREHLEALVEHYSPQMQDYRLAVGRLYRLDPKSISSRLVFVVDDRVVPCPSVRI